MVKASAERGISPVIEVLALPSNADSLIFRLDEYPACLSISLQVFKSGEFTVCEHFQQLQPVGGPEGRPGAARSMSSCLWEARAGQDSPARSLPAALCQFRSSFSAGSPS